MVDALSERGGDPIVLYGPIISLPHYSAGWFGRTACLQYGALAPGQRERMGRAAEHERDPTPDEEPS